MTQRSDEERLAAERINLLFSACPSRDAGHRWNVTLGKCELCDAPMPYVDGETPQGGKDAQRD